ncbi:MAG: hydroxyacid dehydrogenase [Pseudodesulfovibrio sp.]
MPTILATTSSFAVHSPELLEKLGSAGFSVVVNPYARKLTEAELVELLAEHSPVGLLAGTEPVTAAVLEAAVSHLHVVSRIGVGWDNVNHEAARALNIPVYRTEGVLETSVAELTLGFILSALRKLPLHDRRLRGGIWKKDMGMLLSGKTVGVIGFGAIGQRVGEYVTALGAVVRYCDVSDMECRWADQLCLEDLLASSDIVSVHASGSGCVLDEKKLAMCKPGAIIVNTARGGQIDEIALAERLRDGRIGCACLDVFEREPYEGPLIELENAILTPHIGSYALEARVEMEERAVANLLQGLEACKRR